MATSGGTLLLGGWVVAAFAVPAVGSTLTIEHRPSECALAERFPRIEACVTPASALARARVFFQAEGAPYWSSVEMTPAGSCLGAVLPRPAKSARGILYYVVAEDSQAQEVETRQARLAVVESPAACAAGGVVAPVASVSSVIVGSAPGAPSVPHGFLKAGISGAGMSGGLTAISVVGAGVAVGGASAVVARSNSPAPVSNPPSTVQGPVGTAPPMTTPGTPPSTTPPPSTAPPGTSPPPTTQPPGTPPSTTPPSTTPPTTSPPSTTGCSDHAAPDVDMTSPGNGPLSGTSATLEAAASDGGGSGIREVRFHVRQTNTGQETLVGADSDAPYSVVWSLPGCSGPSADPYKIWAEAEDNCGNTAESQRVNVVLCAQQASQSAPIASAWVQRLDVPGGSGQVVMNGAAVSYSGLGAASAAFVPRSGDNQVVATLLGGTGPGVWHFEFPAGALEAGSLTPVAGNVSLMTPDAIAFQLAGRPGERVVFRFRSHSNR